MGSFAHDAMQDVIALEDDGEVVVVPARDRRITDRGVALLRFAVLPQYRHLTLAAAWQSRALHNAKASIGGVQDVGLDDTGSCTCHCQGREGHQVR